MPCIMSSHQVQKSGKKIQGIKQQLSVVDATGPFHENPINSLRKRKGELSKLGNNSCIFQSILILSTLRRIVQLVLL